MEVSRCARKCIMILIVYISTTIEQSSSGLFVKVKSQDAVHTLGSQYVYISETFKPD